MTRRRWLGIGVWLGLGPAAALLLALAGCDSLAAPADDDPQSVQAGAGGFPAGGQESAGGFPAPAQGGVGGGPVSSQPIAGAPSRALPEEVPLDDAQAACLGIVAPVCAGCHGIHGDGLFVLRPAGAPPHPPEAIGATEDQLIACGL